MNRRQKIIVSVTGIFLVLLLLVGLTYAYFLTQVTGNKNDKSISVSTANLAIEYGNDDGSIIGEGETIIPGTTFEPKTFTVTNNGNTTTDYVVVIENVLVTDIATGSETAFESNDFTYTLKCTSGCNGTENSVFPINGGILVGNKIEVGQTQTYSFTLTYEETGIDQSNDMNKSLEARINIKDILSINPYSDNTSSLAYNIIENARKSTNGTKLLSTPDTKPIEEVSLYKELIALDYQINPYSPMTPGWAYGNDSTYNRGTEYLECIDDMIGKYVTDQISLNTYGPVVKCSEEKKPVVLIPGDISEKTLSIIEDDYGTSYYYRGNPEDNFVNFAGMCWRIVRIEGDGSIKLILEDKNTVCNDTVDNDGDGTTDFKYTGDWSLGLGNFGYDVYNFSNYLKPTENADKSMIKYFYDFQTTGKLKDYVEKLKSGGWCYNDIPYKNVDGKYEKISEEEENKIRTGISYGSIYYSLALLNKNLLQPSLKCIGTTLTEFVDNVVDGQELTQKSLMFVGGLDALEISISGFKPEQVSFTNEDSYLINSEFKKTTNGLINNFSFYTISPTYYERNSYDNSTHSRAHILAGDGTLISQQDRNEAAIRPAVRLLEGTEIVEGGEGTIANPYVIN